MSLLATEIQKVELSDHYLTLHITNLSSALGPSVKSIPNISASGVLKTIQKTVQKGKTECLLYKVSTHKGGG